MLLRADDPLSESASLLAEALTHEMSTPNRSIVLAMCIAIDLCGIHAQHGVEGESC